MVNLRTTPDERKRLAELEQAAGLTELHSVNGPPEGVFTDKRVKQVTSAPGKTIYCFARDPIDGRDGQAEIVACYTGTGEKAGFLVEAIRMAPALLADLDALEAECRRLESLGIDAKMLELIDVGRTRVELLAENGQLKAECDALARKLAECQYERGK